jgi:hypothetical protein
MTTLHLFALNVMLSNEMAKKKESAGSNKAKKSRTSNVDYDRIGGPDYDYVYIVYYDDDGNVTSFVHLEKWVLN